MTRQSIVFSSEFDDPEAWRRILEAELPDMKLMLPEEITDPAMVRAALIWDPPADFFSRYPNLQLIINLGAGVDALLARSDLPRQIPITRLNDDGMVALMTSYLMYGAIRYARNFPEMERAQRERRWHFIRPKPLHSVKIGMLGLGNLGGPAASALASLQFDVRGWVRTARTLPGVSIYVGAGQLDDFLSELDILIVMLPKTPQTYRLIGERELARLPRGARIINASRGSVMDENALLASLRSGHVSEAMLDVFEVEPLPQGHPFWGMENVTITAHLASISVPEASARDVAESIRRVRSGLEPLHLVNVDRGY